MKVLWISLFLIPQIISIQTGASISASTAFLNSGFLSFQYLSTDQTQTLDCSYSAMSQLLDRYQVVCGKGTNVIKKFSVEFQVKQIKPEPEATYEINFFALHQIDLKPMGESSSEAHLTAPRAKRLEHQGSQSWITLSKGSIAKVSLYQSIENGQASLVAHYNAGL